MFFVIILLNNIYQVEVHELIQQFLRFIFGGFSVNSLVHFIIKQKEFRGKTGD
jgi:hypothetical protein